MHLQELNEVRSTGYGKADAGSLKLRAITNIFHLTVKLIATSATWWKRADVVVGLDLQNSLAIVADLKDTAASDPDADDV
jgi:polyisoprenoid-binding protein YceI